MKNNEMPRVLWLGDGKTHYTRTDTLTEGVKVEMPCNKCGEIFKFQALPSAFNQPQEKVDIEKLKQYTASIDPSFYQTETFYRREGWNECLYHLDDLGYLNTKVCNDKK